MKLSIHLATCLFFAPTLAFSAFAQSPTTSGDTNFQEHNTIQSCFGKDNDFACSLRADNDSKAIGASRPASFSYTANNDGDDSFAIQAAINLRHDLDFAFLNFKSLWHKNNQQKKEQDNFKVSTGVQFEFSNVEDVFDRWVERGKKETTDYRSIYLDVDMGYNRKAIFGDAKADACIAEPTLEACGRQYLETLRLTVNATPYFTKFESNNSGNRPKLYYVFAPSIGLFFDEALNSNVVLLSGEPADGAVAGVVASATFSVSPDVFANKWELSISGQITEALDRAVMRTDDFEESSRLFSASLSYALSGSYLGQKDKNTWLPAASITYTNGSDPLKGRASQDTLMFGLTIKY